MGQNISPPIQIFTAFLLPQLAPQDIPAIQDNFLFDIGNLQEPTNGVVTVETELTPAGEIMADTTGDGIACSFLGGPQAAMINYPVAGGAAFVATTLFQGLLLEARNPDPASFTTLLGALLARTEPGSLVWRHLGRIWRLGEFQICGHQNWLTHGTRVYA
jgi:hypothetical protein